MAASEILLADTVHPELPEGLRRSGFVLHEEYQRSPEAMDALLERCTGLILRSRFPVDKALLQMMPQLRFIGRVGAGLENIDLAAAEARGIQVLKAPEGNRDAVGEHALGMLLMLLHHLRRADAEVHAGIWKREENRGTELNSLTVGIMGFGFMGSAFAEKLSGMGCRILAYDKYKTGYAPAGVEETSLAKLRQHCDVLSLHLPLSAETRGLVNRKFLKSFAKPIFLINTARGPIVQSRDLADALDENVVRGACLDTLEYEKSSFEGLFDGAMPEPMQRLLKNERVVFSPHIAGWTQESHRRMAEVILKKIEDLNI